MFYTVFRNRIIFKKNPDISVHSLPGHRGLLYEVDILGVESGEVVSSRRCGVGVARAVTVEQCGVRFTVQVADLSVQT